MFKLFALLIAAILWGVWGVLRLRESEGEQIRQFLEKFSRLGVVNKIAILLVVGHLAIFAGGKHGATNDSDQGSGPLMMPPPVAMLNPRPTPDFYLSAVGTNESFDFSVPVDGEIQTNWMLRGAAADYFHLGIDDWEFPFGSASVSNMVVFANGSVVFPTNTCLAPFSTVLGIAPVANWGLLAESNRPSLFWRKVNSDNTLLLTWQNVLLDRQPTNPVSFQVELNPNGNFAFRYDLSGIASDELLTNVVVTADNGNRATLPLFQDGISTILTNGQTVATPFTRDVSSLTFKSADEKRCDEFREDFDERLGGEDPYSYPQGSTNTVLEHLFYSGTTNGAFAYPQSSDGVAVLWVSVSGTGSGELIVGSSTVPIRGRVASTSPRLLAAPPPSPSTLGITVPRGMTCPVYLRGDGTLSVSYDSDDFAFGELPDLSGRHFKGWINFPFVNATVPCIHDYNARQKEVSLPVGSGAGDLTCTWQGTAQIEAENHPPRSALLTGHFSGRATTPVSYTLEHPQYLFGQATYSQTARYCPPPPDDDDDDDEDPSGGGYYDGDDDDDEEHYCWCCFWGSCWEGCGCGCSCTFPGGDDEPEDPPVDPEPEDYDESSTNYPHLTGVLKLRTNPVYTQPIHLTVPDEHRNCCPCPDHASNWVAVVYQSRRLKVVDVATDMDFSRSGESVDVKIAGVSPSSEIGDAEVSFAANGEVCLECSYTTLGVGIGKSDVDLNRLNSINPYFGLPISVCSNDEQMTDLYLETNVRLPAGNIHVGFEDAVGDFALWVWDSDFGDYRLIADTDSGPLDISFAGWRQLVGGSSDPYFSQTPIYVTSTSSGVATLVYRYWAVIDGKFVEDVAKQSIASLDPPLMVDYNRDGQIDDNDVRLYQTGLPYRFWTNPSIAVQMRGANELVNFFPMAVDFSRLANAWGDSATYTLRNWDSDIRFCILDGVSPEYASMIWTEDIMTSGNEHLSATVPLPMRGGAELNDILSDGSGVLAVTAGDVVNQWSSPEIVVHIDGTEVYSFRLPMSLHPVRDMYRFLNIRASCGDDRSVQTNSAIPINLPDDETDGRHFIFVHGYNVNPTEAREWADTMFKRLLVSGSQAAFTAVTWFGDETQFYVPLVGNVTPDYYSNVENALNSAPDFAVMVSGLPGRQKCIAAHSLGNMLVSSAIVDCGLSYDKYFMFDAAVPLEAYDQSSVTETTRSNMTPGSWRNYENRLRANHWFELFDGEDARSELTWKGRFAGLANAVNYYSSEEDVLANADGQDHAFPAAAYIWMNQETRKGVWPMLLPGNNEAGWSFNAAYDIPNPDFHGQGDELMLRRTPQLAAQIPNDCLKVSPFFGPFDDMSICTTNRLTSIPQKSQLLADAMPAESYAAGRNPVAVWGVSRNVDMIQFRKTGSVHQWDHSFIKSADYSLIFRLYKDILERSR